MIKNAFKFLIYDKAKSFGALFGVIISIFLIGQQCGIFIFLTNAMSSLARNNPQYIWVVDNTTENVNALAQLDVRIGQELNSVEGVSKVYPMVVAAGSAKFDNGTTAGVTVIGTQAPDFAGGPWNLTVGAKEMLLQDGAVTADFFDKKVLGGSDVGTYFEINGKQVYIAAQTKGVRAFGGGVYTFTTLERARYLGNVSPYKASAFLLTIADSASEEDVIARINGHINGVRAWNAKKFSTASIITVLKSSGIAISIGTLLFFALIVGFVIIGLTLYSAAIDRIKDYGTLKAIGATNGYIRKLIITQALIVSAFGFVFAMMLVEGFRNGIAKAGTLFDYPLWLRFVFLLVTVFIAISGSMFAIRRITKLEPAAVFRG
jgi:putative ABC transport system permease protein